MGYEKRKRNVEQIKGLDANMRQGNRGRKGDASSKVGNVSKVMGQGSRKDQNSESKVGKLSSIMGQ